MRTIWLVVLPCVILCAACSTPPDKKGAEPSSARATKKTTATKRKTTRAADGDEKLVTANKPVPRASEAEIRDFNRIWELYRKADRRWPLERDRFKVRSEAAGYLLAGHLLRHYMTVNAQRDRAGRQLVAVKNEIVAVGEPCVAPLVNLMVLERVRSDGDNYFVIDDLTRQDCIDMLERIGAASVPELIRTVRRKDLGAKGRRLAALALGGTKDPRAYEPLVQLLRKDPSWQVRADAATALAKLGDSRAVRPLTDAIKTDSDPAVVRRAGKARYELLKSGGTPMTEYKIRKRAPACMASGRPFQAGDVIVSAIYPDPESEGFVRRDVLEDEFVQDGSAFSYWKTVHEEEPTEERRVDLDLALSFLDRLIREADPAREGLVYTLTLLLSRKRRVKIKETRQLPEGELLTILVPGAEEDQLVQVRAPTLDDGQVEKLQSQLAELFDFGDAAADEPAENA